MSPRGCRRKKGKGKEGTSKERGKISKSEMSRPWQQIVLMEFMGGDLIKFSQ